MSSVAILVKIAFYTGYVKLYRAYPIGISRKLYILRLFISSADKGMHSNTENVRASCIRFILYLDELLYPLKFKCAIGRVAFVNLSNEQDQNGIKKQKLTF